MTRDTYDRIVIFENLNPCFLLLLEKNKLSAYSTKYETLLGSNILYKLKVRAGEALGLNDSQRYLSVDEGITIEEKKLVLQFKQIPADKADIKPSEFRKRVEKVLEEIANESGVKSLYKAKK